MNGRDFLRAANIFPALILLPILLFSSTQQAPASANPLCRWGGKTISVTLVMADGATPVPLLVDTAYFTQSSTPHDENVWDGLLLHMQATDFSPWPEKLRVHQSEGPLLSFLVAKFVPFDLALDRKARSNAGYGFLETVNWQEEPGPYGLFRLTAPPPDPPRRGGLIGKNDVFYARNDAGEISDIVSCRRPSELPYRSCNHLIEGGDTDLQLRYAPEFLADWKRLSVMAADFFECMKKE